MVVEPCLPDQVYDSQVLQCVCAAGYFFNSSLPGYPSLPSVSGCQACPDGYVSAIGQLACRACAAGTYAINKTDDGCILCPRADDGTWSAFSPSASHLLTNCSCGYGYYPSPYPPVLPNDATFECSVCPDGALCDDNVVDRSVSHLVSVIPLALEGFWHPPCQTSAMYECEEGRCVSAQTPACCSSPDFPPHVSPTMQANPKTSRQSRSRAVRRQAAL